MDLQLARIAGKISRQRSYSKFFIDAERLYFYLCCYAMFLKEVIEGLSITG
jgi:hypothetical protein